MSNGQYELALFAHRYANFFGVYAYAPFTIAKAYHAELQEIIARANWGHEYARFELNPDSGQFRCASTAYLPDGTLSTAMIEHLSFFILEWLDSLVGTLADMRDDS